MAYKSGALPERYFAVRVRKTVLEIHEVYAADMEDAIGRAISGDAPKVTTTLSLTIEASHPGPTHWRRMLYNPEENR